VAALISVYYMSENTVALVQFIWALHKILER
jgi:hypothetical protein